MGLNLMGQHKNNHTSNSLSESKTRCRQLKKIIIEQEKTISELKKQLGMKKNQKVMKEDE